MAQFNPDFWEIPTDISNLDRLPAHEGMYYETGIDRDRRYAMQDFYEEVTPAVTTLISASLTKRQREIVQLYYGMGKTQEDIAAILDLTQSTVSRHLFGTVRDGKKVGGAIPKLQKLIDRNENPHIIRALSTLQGRLAEAV